MRHSYVEIITKGEFPTKQGDIDELYRALRDWAHLDLPPKPPGSRSRTIGRSIRTLVAVVFVGFTGYIVIGGILAGQAELEGVNPLVLLGVLALVLVLLALVEGLEIAVTKNSERRLDQVAKEYPRAHQVNTSVVGTATTKFLSGRQVLVILLVFIVAHLTSFPNMTKWPGTQIDFFEWMMPWFPQAFLRWGLLGAFLVVWLGQLLPKLIAQRRSREFMNMRSSAALARLSVELERTGLTWLSTAISDRFPEEEELPASQRELYRMNLAGRGLGVLRHSVNVEFDANEREASVEDSRSFHLSRSYDEIGGSIEFPWTRVSSRRHEWQYQKLFLPDGSESQATLLCEADSPSYQSGSTYNWRVAPKQGIFEPGHVVCFKIKFSFSGVPVRASDSLRIELSSPVRQLEVFATFRVWRAKKAWISMTRMGESEPYDRIRLLPIETNEHLARFHFICDFPELGTVYSLDWQFEIPGLIAEGADEATSGLEEFVRR
jgi:hypothetical protein